MASNGTSSAASGGIGVFGLLGVAFIVLKLCHVIDWSWWWVTCPFWAPLAVLFGILAACGLVVGLIAIVQAAGARR